MSLNLIYWVCFISNIRGRKRLIRIIFIFYLYYYFIIIIIKGEFQMTSDTPSQHRLHRHIIKILESRFHQSSLSWSLILTPEESQKQRGIIPRAVEKIFEHIERTRKAEVSDYTRETTFSVQCSFLQLYNENVEDLLSSRRKSLNIRQNPERGVYVEDLRVLETKSKASVFRLIKKGFQRRATASTALNDVSSRSHAIFRIIFRQEAQIYSKNGELGS